MEMNEKKSQKLINKKDIFSNNFSKKKSIFITLFLIIIRFKICSLKKLLYNSEIILTIKGSGTQRILSDNFGHIPSQILVNENEINEIKYYVDNLSDDINNITLVWNYSLTNCSHMFHNLENITNIYFTNFNTSQVEYMDYMFSSCISITKLDLTSFDTSSVKNMSRMFYYCLELTLLDISTFNTKSVLDMSYMFCYTITIRSINLTSFDTSSVTDISGMFSHMYKISTLNLSNFDTSNVIYMNHLFAFSIIRFLDVSNFNTSLVVNMESMFLNNFFTSINISHFDTSLVTDMSSMFDACILLTSLDLSNFNTSSLTLMGDMFASCNSLTFLNLSNLDTSSVNRMYRMFYDCHKLTSLDLSNFNTDKVFDMLEMFYNCTSLITLNIDNFNFSSINSINSMFYNCSSLISLDLHKNNLNIKNTHKYINNNIFKGCNNNLTICISNERNNDNSYIVLDQLSNFNKNCSDICFMEGRKIITNISKCTMNCETEYIDKYEYNNLCYQSCPKDTYYSYDNNYLCILGSKEKPEIESFSNFYTWCKFNSLNNGNKTKDEIIQNIRNELIKGNLDILISKYIEEEKKDFLVNDTDNNILHQFTSTYNQNNSNTNITNNIGNKFSVIKLGICENLLRTKYGLKDNDIILLYKVDLFEQGHLIPIIEYEIYNPKKREKLELDICNNIKINIEIPVLINEDEEFKHDNLNGYYNDFCYSYTTQNKTDIILKDRRKEFINNNMSLCEKDCEYKGYDFNNKRALCECFIKIKFPLISDVLINKDKFLNNFIDLKKNINLDVMKCYKTLFSTKGIKTNIGFYIILFIIVIIVILAIIFKVKGFKIFNDKIDEIVKIKKESIMIETNRNNIDKDNVKNNNDNINNNKNNVNNIEKNNNYIINSNKCIKKRKIKKKIIIKKKILKLRNKDSIYNKSQLTDLKNSIDSNKIKNNNFNSLDYNDKNIIFANYNDYEMNNLNYEEAIKIDKRNFMQYYLSLIKTKHVLIFTFYTKSDYNSRIIKIILFFFSFALYYTINALFFTDSTMHKIYEDQGNFNFIYQIPKILYSSIISSIISVVVKLLSLTEKNIIEIKNEKNNIDEKVSEVLKCLLIKFVLFFEFVFMFLILFWYYLSCFGAVYKNTQIHLFKDTIISYMLSLIYPFGLNIIPCLFRIPSLKAPENKKKKILYKISIYLQLI